jgi:hypothetical protein
MAISSYKKDDKILWEVYIDIKSRKDRTLRVQKRIKGIESEKLALSEEKKLLKELSSKLVSLETQGIKWNELISRWERYQELYPSKRYAQTTIEDYVSLLRNWTTPWLNRVASDLNRGDGREIIRYAQDKGKSASFCKHLKNTINLFYNWGI